MIKSIVRILAGATALALAPAAANAAVVVNITEAAGNVLIDTSGSIDLTGLSSQGGFGLDLGLGPNIGYVSGGTSGSVTGYSGLRDPRRSARAALSTPPPRPGRCSRSTQLRSAPPR